MSSKSQQQQQRRTHNLCKFFHQLGACKRSAGESCNQGFHGSVTHVASTQLSLAEFSQLPTAEQVGALLVAQYKKSFRCLGHFFLKQQTESDHRTEPYMMGRSFFSDKLQLLPADIQSTAATASSRLAEIPVYAKPSTLPIKLKQGDSSVFLVAPSILPIVECMRSARLFPPPASTSNPTALSFVTFRNNLNKFINDASWKCLVQRIGNTVFLLQTQFPICNFGLVGRQFESKCVGNESPNEFCTVVHSCLGTHRLYIGAEIDMLDHARQYVEVKTTKTDHATTDMSVLKQAEQQRIWAQCFFARVSRLIVGVDECPTRGEASITDVLDFELNDQSFPLVEFAWKEQRLKHVRRILDWVTQCCAQRALEEHQVYWLEQAPKTEGDVSAFNLSLSQIDSAHSFLVGDVIAMF